MTESLSNQTELWQLVNDAHIDGIVIYDRQLNVLYWNRAASVLTGIDRMEAEGSNFHRLFPFQHHDGVMEAIQQAFSGKDAMVPYEALQLPEFQYEFYFKPLDADDSAARHIMHLIRDISPRIRVGNELKALNKALVRKNRELTAKSDEILAFSQVTSVGMEEPLYKIYSSIEMIINREGARLPEWITGHLKRVQGSTQRMRMVANDLYLFYEISRRKMHYIKIDLNRLASRMKQQFQHIASFDDCVKLEKQLPEVSGDPATIQLLFRNVIGNAIKFHRPEASPQVNINCKLMNADEMRPFENRKACDYYCIEFQDNGIGFDMKEREKIFQMFYRLNKNKYPGTGIGLAFCKKIVELHHGWIEAESELGIGSTFRIYLPVE